LVAPHETDPVLVIDSDGVLSGPVSPQPFQPISGRHKQFRKIDSGIENRQLLAGGLSNRRRKPTAPAGFPKSLGLAICEAYNQLQRY
jgi:hypothetical protein